jgi:putative intracellular protease/amidase
MGRGFGRQISGEQRRPAMRSIRWLCWLLLPTFAWAQANPRDVTVAILMFDGVQIIDYAAPYEVFAQAGFTVYTVSKDGRPVKAAQGLKSDVDHSFATAPAARIVVVPGGSVHDAQRDAELIAWLRKQSASAEHVMSVCTGSFILGSAGLLDGHAATTFHAAFDEMQRQFPKSRILRDQRWVDTGKVVTSAGLASGIDTSLHVVSEVRGLKAARSVAMRLEYDWKPDDGFVRGRFADRHLRLPATLRTPENTKIAEVSSLGDLRRWEIVYRVESDLDSARLLDHFAQQARQDPGFTVTREGRGVVWEYPSHFGGRWRMSVVASEAAAAGVYELTGTLEESVE